VIDFLTDQNEEATSQENEEPTSQDNNNDNPEGTS